MTITEVSFTEASTGSPGVVINGTVGDESVKATVWITEKSANLAHKALKNCGFDSDKQDLSELKEKPTLLRGHEVEVNVSENEFGIKCEIALDQTPDEAKMKSANAMLKGRPKDATKTVPSAPVSSPF